MRQKASEKEQVRTHYVDANDDSWRASLRDAR